MKALLKVLGAAALVAGLTPYSVKKNEESSETTYQALLWKMTSRPNPEEETKKDYTLTLSFNPPEFKTKKSAEAEMFADHLMDCEDVCQCECSCDCGCSEEDCIPAEEILSAEEPEAPTENAEI